MQWGEETPDMETGKSGRQSRPVRDFRDTGRNQRPWANVTFARQQKPGQDFFPLPCTSQEKYYAAVKVPGGFFKREARPTRKKPYSPFDRPVRSARCSVPASKTEVLVSVPFLSHDLVNDPVYGRDDRRSARADHFPARRSVGSRLLPCRVVLQGGD